MPLAEAGVQHILLHALDLIGRKRRALVPGMSGLTTDPPAFLRVFALGSGRLADVAGGQFRGVRRDPAEPGHLSASNSAFRLRRAATSASSSFSRRSSHKMMAISSGLERFPSFEIVMRVYYTYPLTKKIRTKDRERLLGKVRHGFRLK